MEGKAGLAPHVIGWGGRGLNTPVSDTESMAAGPAVSAIRSLTGQSLKRDPSPAKSETDGV